MDALKSVRASRTIILGLAAANFIVRWILAALRGHGRLLRLSKNLFSLAFLLVAQQPGGTAEAVKQRVLPGVGVSVASGYFEEPISLKLTSTVDGAALRYTGDGSEPTVANGVEYR